jgi:[ribosomal protein S18]-alanine N-acetyltransferase
LKVLVRHATAEDIPAMMALEQAATVASHWSRKQYEQIFALAATGAELMSSEQDRKALLVEEQSVQGFLIGRSLGEEWEIENIVVAGSARKRGLGTHLLSHFLWEAHRYGARAVFLEVRESNCAARALYGKCGFRQSGRRKAYYHHPTEDAILYRLCFP